MTNMKQSHAITDRKHDEIASSEPGGGKAGSYKHWHATPIRTDNSCNDIIKLHIEAMHIQLVDFHFYARQLYKKKSSLIKNKSINEQLKNNDNNKKNEKRKKLQQPHQP